MALPHPGGLASASDALAPEGSTGPASPGTYETRARLPLRREGARWLACLRLFFGTTCTGFCPRFLVVCFNSSDLINLDSF
jgi:hypothetical protein